LYRLNSLAQGRSVEASPRTSPAQLAAPSSGDNGLPIPRRQRSEHLRRTGSGSVTGRWSGGRAAGSPAVARRVAGDALLAFATGSTIAPDISPDRYMNGAMGVSGRQYHPQLM